MFNKWKTIYRKLQKLNRVKFGELGKVCDTEIFSMIASTELLLTTKLFNEIHNYLQTIAP